MRLPSLRAVSFIRHANARELLGVRIFGQAGDGLLQTALATFVLFSPQRESDPRKIALAFGILLLPYSVIGPFVGVLIDRWSRRTILIRANLVRVITMLAIAIVITGHSPNSLLAVLVLVSLGVNRFVQAALSASLPHVVKGEDLVPANALFPTLGTTAAAFAAAFGIATQSVFSNSDTVNATLVGLGAFCAGIAGIIAIRIKPKHILGPDIIESAMREEFRNALAGLAAGFQYMARSGRVLSSMFAVAFQRWAFGALTVHVLLLSRNSWHTNASADQAVLDFGLVAGAAAFGAFSAAILSTFLLSDKTDETVAANLLKPHRQVHLIAAMSVAVAVSVVVTFIGYQVGTLTAVIAAAATLGFAGQLLKINADTTIQRNIDDAHRGRVFSIFDMMINVALVIGITSYSLIEAARENANVGASYSVVLLSASTGLSIFLFIKYRKPIT
ncbi:MAG: MFS transporter [Candidatus Nanopelagicales bacterium]|nr:MFS transporter [Candidatus Nanopelagicales bacterium]